MSQLRTDLDPIVIVGAGPTGLTLGISLLQRGVPCRILDRADSPRVESRAFTWHARSMEAAERAGYADRLLARGIRSRSMDYHVLGATGDIARLDFAGVQSRYPFTLIINQNVSEEVLRERFAELGGQVEWARSVQRVRRDETGRVSVTVRDTTVGADMVVESDWLVGCDGVYSTVREELGLEFAGGRYTGTATRMLDGPLWRLDAEGNKIGWGYDDDRIHYFIHPDRMLLVTLLPSGDYRVLISDRGETADVDVSLEGFQRVLDEHIPGGGVILGQPTWGPRAFDLARRQSSGYRDGNIYLCGDAAHSTSIIAGQGMNVCVQDAENLGWKLALAYKLRVTHGPAAAQVPLATYAAQRHRVGEVVLDATHTLHGMVMGHGGDLRERFRAAEQPGYLDGVTRQVSGMDYTYRDTIPIWPGYAAVTGGLTVGDRFPHIELAPGTFTHDLLHHRWYTLLVLQQIPGSMLPRRAKQTARDYGEYLAVRVIASSEVGDSDSVDVVAERDEVFEHLADSGDILCLLTPDSHVAALCGSADLTDLYTILGTLPVPAAAAATTGATLATLPAGAA